MSCDLGHMWSLCHCAEAKRDQFRPLTCADSGETLGEALYRLAPGEPVMSCPSPFARAKEPVGVGMAKAILGQRVYRDDRLVLEAARLRSRVRDLETLIEDLQNDNCLLYTSDAADE